MSEDDLIEHYPWLAKIAIVLMLFILGSIGAGALYLSWSIIVGLFS